MISYVYTNRRIGLYMYPTKEQYAAALSKLLEGSGTIIKNGLTMMQAHYYAENHALSPEDLARAVGYDSGNAANSQYGTFAHELCDILNFKPPEAKDDDNTSWTYVIGTYPGTLNFKNQKVWVMRKEVAHALEALDLVQKKRTASIVEDIEAMAPYLGSLAVKDRDQMIRARVGQGKFRERVINFWEACSVTGATLMELLVASHIKPWNACDLSDALNPANGLLLTSNLDKAFDRGYITFDDSARIVFSTRLSETDAHALGISKTMSLRKDVSEWQRPFFEYHRDIVFLRSK